MRNLFTPKGARRLNPGSLYQAAGTPTRPQRFVLYLGKLSRRNDNLSEFAIPEGLEAVERSNLSELDGLRIDKPMTSFGHIYVMLHAVQGDRLIFFEAADEVTDFEATLWEEVSAELVVAALEGAYRRDFYRNMEDPENRAKPGHCVVYSEPLTIGSLGFTLGTSASSVVDPAYLGSARIVDETRTSFDRWVVSVEFEGTKTVVPFNRIGLDQGQGQNTAFVHETAELQQRIRDHLSADEDRQWNLEGIRLTWGEMASVMNSDLSRVFEQIEAVADTQRTLK